MSDAKREQLRRQKELDESLHDAAYSGSYEEVAELIEQGADVNFATHPDEQTVLMRACDEGETQVVALLVARGARIDTVDYDGKTPLMFAGKAGGSGKVRLLIERGAATDPADGDGMTALMFAATYDDAGSCWWLLAAGADAEARDADGRTALLQAIIADSPDAAEVLLAKGADASATDAKGRTAMDYATESDSDLLVELLTQPPSQFSVRKPLLDGERGPCPICAEPVEGRAHRCPKCDSPHHPECWALLGACPMCG